jgi:hypothetical protein
MVVTSTKHFASVCLVVGLGVVGCGGSGEEAPASGEAVTGDALERCLLEEGLGVERGKAAPLRLNAGPVTPQAGLVVSPDSSPRSEILVLEEEDAESYDQSLPPDTNDDRRFGANVVVLVTDAGPVGAMSEFKLPVPGRVRRALDACVS